MRRRCDQCGSIRNAIWVITTSPLGSERAQCWRCWLRQFRPDVSATSAKQADKIIRKGR